MSEVDRITRSPVICTLTYYYYYYYYYYRMGETSSTHDAEDKCLPKFWPKARTEIPLERFKSKFGILLKRILNK